MNKKKLSREILGLTSASFLVGICCYGFMRVMANSVVLSYCNKMSISLDSIREWEITNFIQSVSLVAGVAIFIVLFLFLVGERIEKAVKELQEKENLLKEERETFIRGLSHDIRTPLTSILSYSEYMKTKETIEEADMLEYISMVQRKAEQMKNLTDQLLDGGVRKLEYVEDGKLLMIQLADEWETALETGFQCEVDLTRCPAFAGEFDIREMRRVFDNLVSNVEKYADAEHTVYLGVYEKEKGLVIHQRNHRKKDFLKEESRGIGLESIRKIAESYDGGTNMTLEDDLFSLEIIFRIL